MVYTQSEDTLHLLSGVLSRSANNALSTFRRFAAGFVDVDGCDLF